MYPYFVSACSHLTLFFFGRRSYVHGVCWLPFTFFAVFCATALSHAVRIISVAYYLAFLHYHNWMTHTLPQMNTQIWTQYTNIILVNVRYVASSRRLRSKRQPAANRNWSRVNRAKRENVPWRQMKENQLISKTHNTVKCCPFYLIESTIHALFHFDNKTPHLIDLLTRFREFFI